MTESRFFPEKEDLQHIQDFIKDGVFTVPDGVTTLMAGFTQSAYPTEDGYEYEDVDFSYFSRLKLKKMILPESVVAADYATFVDCNFTIQCGNEEFMKNAAEALGIRDGKCTLLGPDEKESDKVQDVIKLHKEITEICNQVYDKCDIEVDKYEREDAHFSIYELVQKGMDLKEAVKDTFMDLFPNYDEETILKAMDAQEQKMQEDEREDI